MINSKVHSVTRDVSAELQHLDQLEEHSVKMTL